MEVKDIKDAIEPMVQALKNEAAQNEQKHAEAVAQINEEMKKQGNSAAEIKAAVDKLNAELAEMKAAEGRKTFAGGKTKSFADELKEGLEGVKDQFANFKGGREEILFSIKSVQNMLSSTTHTGDLDITQVRNSPAFGQYSNHLRAILPIFASASDVVNYAQEVVPSGEGSFGTQTEGSAETQIDLDTKMVTLNLTTEAAYVKVSRQMLRNLSFLSQYINNQLVEKFARHEDVKYLNAIAASATAASTGASATIEKLIDYIAQVYAAGYMPNGIMTTAAGWAAIMKTKPSDYNTPANVVISPTGQALINGLPVYVNQSVTAGKVYVGDWSKAAIAQSESFNIRTSEYDQDDFVKNLVTVRAEAAVGLIEYAPSAFVYGAF